MYRAGLCALRESLSAWRGNKNLLVVSDHLDDLLVVGRGDHGVELAQDTLLHRED